MADRAARTLAAVAADLDVRRAAAGPGWTPGVAVSGGSDSTGLLLAAHGWAQTRGVPLACATVDHRLRPQSRAEAEGVAALCASLSVTHDILTWRHDGAPSGNLAAAARDARRALLADWARGRALDAVLLAHTEGDQAETVLLRLARGAGVDGLSGMADSVRAHGVTFARPTLALTRDDLRSICIAHGISWVEDPTNDDLTHDRPRARAALAALAPLGIDAAGLAATAARLRGQRVVLEDAADALAAQALRWGGAGEARLSLARYGAAPTDLRLRVLAQAIAALSGARRPRQRALGPLDAAVLAGRARTLAGVVIAPAGAAEVALWREAVCLPPPVAAVDGAVWDGRWRVRGAVPEGAIWGALGDAGLRDLAARALPTGWSAAPRGARGAAPCLRWCGALIFAPLAGYKRHEAFFSLEDLRLVDSGNEI
ncbi:MAG: tRNA(Ile)-lysidine synthase [Paracoccaceae bacterium]